MSKPESISTNISFHGDDVRTTLEANPLVYQAIWDACSGYSYAQIRIDAHPRIESTDTLEWTMSIASPGGRRTMLITQQSPTSSVRFSNQ